MINYYLITGLDCGVEIEPFIVETLSPPLAYLQERVDMVRYYQVLTEAEAKKLIALGVEVY